ncbi:unnamed protein product [Schistosoma intercalatum]|nr:unnamed protein product [Schistosoma intercalatum]CAH8496464.1 unnamed protein product [Schistosoma intercalatum]
MTLIATGNRNRTKFNKNTNNRFIQTHTNQINIHLKVDDDDDALDDDDDDALDDALDNDALDDDDDDALDDALDDDALDDDDDDALDDDDDDEKPISISLKLSTECMNIIQ